MPTRRKTAYDALTQKRPYKPAWPRAEAIQEITNQSGHQFDPRVVDAFLALDQSEYHQSAVADQLRTGLEHIADAA